jgi:hypothetical protein
VVGHRDLSPDLDNDGEISENERLKSCPCFDVKTALKAFRGFFFVESPSYIRRRTATYKNN